MTNEECQSLMNFDHEWEDLDAVKLSGARVKMQLADVVVRNKQHPTILKEQIMKYAVGDFVEEHTDSYWRWIRPAYIARAVWITPLNDNYEGGELYVEGKLVEQVVGVPIKHFILTPHEVKPVTKGTRYSLVSWVFVPKSMEKLK